MQHFLQNLLSRESGSLPFPARPALLPAAREREARLGKGAAIPMDAAGSSLGTG